MQTHGGRTQVVLEGRPGKCVYEKPCVHSLITKVGCYHDHQGRALPRADMFVDFCLV